VKTAKNRLLEFLAHLDIGQNAFEKNAGIANGYISHNKGSIGSDILAKISAAYPELNTVWLLTGEGDMLRSNDGTYSINEAGVGTPVYDLDATCGPEVRDVSDEKVIGYVNLPGINPNSHILVATGDSMAPKIMNGDRVVLREIESWDYIAFGQIYLIMTQEYRMIKYIRKHKDDNYIILRSENPAFDDIEIPKSEIVRLFLVENILSVKNLI